MENATVKLIEYQLAKGVEEAVFLGASAALMPELAKLRGFIKRELHRAKTESGVTLCIGRVEKMPISLKSNVLSRRSRNQTGRKMEKLEPPVKCLQRPVDIGRNARPEIFSARKRDDSIG